MNLIVEICRMYLWLMTLISSFFVIARRSVSGAPDGISRDAGRTSFLCGIRDWIWNCRGIRDSNICGIRDWPQNDRGIRDSSISREWVKVRRYARLIVFFYPFVRSLTLRRLSLCGWNDTRLFFIRMYFIGILKTKVAENIRMFRGSNSNQLKKFPCTNVVRM